MRRAIVVAALTLGIATLGWNPLFPPTSFRWSTAGPVVWNPDGGTLGMLSNGEAVADIAAAFATWQNVSTSSITFAQGAQIVDGTGTPVDVTSANFAQIVNLNNGQNPIIFDNDRDIFDALGVPAGLAGFAVPQFASGTTIVKSIMIVEGDFIDGEPIGTPPSDPGEISRDSIRAVEVHEIGHFVALGHTTANRGIAGIGGCPAPTDVHWITMNPTVPEDAMSLHFDDEVGLSTLYPTAAFNSQPRITGNLIGTTGSTFDGGNIIARRVTADCDEIYNDAQAMQSGSFPEIGGAGGFSFAGLAGGSQYTVQATSIVDSGAYPIGQTNPPPLGAPNEFYNGPDEDWFQPPDDPSVSSPVRAGTTGIEIRLQSPFSAGTLPGVGPAALRVDKFDGTTALPPHPLLMDDGGVTSAWGFNGPFQQAWANRFTPDPADLPYRIERMDVMFWHPSAAPGRGIRLLVYLDPAGTGDPANAMLVHSQDTAIQSPLSSTTFQQFPLTSPVLVESGDVYLGVFDLVADQGTAFISAYDEDTGAGRGWLQVGGTLPGDFALCGPVNGSCNTDRTWMIRAFGSHIPAAGTIGLTWGAPCNEATTPNQDFAVYHADLGVVSHDPLACSTDFRRNYIPPTMMGDKSWLVTPTWLSREGNLSPHTLGSTCQAVGPDDCP